LISVLIRDIGTTPVVVEYTTDIKVFQTINLIDCCHRHDWLKLSG
jgi:hypothetical protein